MSLTGALSVAGTALDTSQAALQVTGNNIANASDPNYAREVATPVSNADEQIGPSLYIGTGVDLSAVQRQVDESLNSQVNSAVSDYQSANTLQQSSGQLQSVFSALGSNSLQDQLNTFTNDWSQLANDPTSTSQRQVVISDGQALAQQFNDLGGQIGTMQTDLGQQLTSVTSNASQLAQQIASLNQQIATSGGGDNSLLDQRDGVVQQLAQLVNVQTVNQGNGTVNVYVGSEPLVVGTASNGLAVQQTQVNGQPVYNVVFASNNGNATVTGGQIGGLLSSQTQLNTVQQQLNSLAAGLSFGLNSIYSSGQGTEGYTSVTGTNQVLSSTAVLNSSSAGLAFAPVNGSFVITTTNTQTGLASSTLIGVNLTGSPTDTTLSSLAASLNAVGNVQASIQGGKLSIASTDPNEQITFSQDSSNVLAALGINTFFQGNSALNIAVNSTVANNPQYLAAAQNGESGDNQNALAIANFATTAQSTLGGQSWTDSYNSMINGMATTAAQAQSNTTATQDVQDTLQTQQQSLSGVSLNDETINMLQQQKAFQGAAMLVTTINQMMTSLMDIMGTAV